MDQIFCFKIQNIMKISKRNQDQDLVVRELLSCILDVLWFTLKLKFNTDSSDTNEHNVWSDNDTDYKPTGQNQQQMQCKLILIPH